MQWQDEGIILGHRSLGERDVIVELMTHHHGRHAGVIKYGRSRKNQSVLQTGNGVQVRWNARLESHLGQFQFDLTVPRAGLLLENSLFSAVAMVLASHLHQLPERDPHEQIYQLTDHILTELSTPQSTLHVNEVKSANLRGEGFLNDILIQLAMFECTLLQDMGFGMDLSCCVRTGSESDLAYVSPRTGCAVSKAAAGQWRDKLLPLPKFIWQWANSGTLPEHDQVSKEHIAQALKLTGHFIHIHIYEPRQLKVPFYRNMLFRHVSE